MGNIYRVNNFFLKKTFSITRKREKPQTPSKNKRVGESVYILFIYSYVSDVVQGKCTTRRHSVNWR